MASEGGLKTIDDFILWAIRNDIIHRDEIVVKLIKFGFEEGEILAGIDCLVEKGKIIIFKDDWYCKLH